LLWKGLNDGRESLFVFAFQNPTYPPRQRVAGVRLVEKWERVAPSAYIGAAYARKSRCE